MKRLLCIFPFNGQAYIDTQGAVARDAQVMASLREQSNLAQIIFFRPLLIFKEPISFLKKIHKVKYVGGSLVIDVRRKGVSFVTPISFSIVRPLIRRRAYIFDLYKNKESVYRSYVLRAIKDSGYSAVTRLDFSPFSVEVLQGEAAFNFKVFDGIDNLVLHKAYKKFSYRIKQSYKVLRVYDKVFFNSRSSVAYFSTPEFGLGEAKFLRNGVPGKLLEVQSSSVGGGVVHQISYLGKIQSMFDVELVKQLAQATSATIHVYGPELEKDYLKSVRNVHNIKIHGPVSHSVALGVYANTRVFIIPYRANEQHGGDPMKFYEAVASGCTVVSTNIGEISDFDSLAGIYVVPRNKFVSAVVEALPMTRGGGRDKASVDCMLQTWDQVAEAIIF